MSNNYCCIRKPHEQSKTSFGVPKIESECNKWEQRLGMKLKKTHRVCLHFKETDVMSKCQMGKWQRNQQIFL
ncbi:52 kDa repressor of the inhibitor of the protein kinase-like [Aphis craccivora]|uniref:52 kDa repressor of the inhibitor of the protein kinase-like n=1 Tax=Aphis craccivora TaxID=307492 RepID=A0A6G0YI71_APHCR|nr:52 kDa repressor of the inhibitor of the protein kinase-like [Aphis craccivora]